MIITTEPYPAYLERLLVECRAVLVAAAEHDDDWPSLGLKLVLDKIDRLDIEHRDNPSRCPATIDMLDKMKS